MLVQCRNIPNLIGPKGLDLNSTGLYSHEQLVINLAAGIDILNKEKHFSFILICGPTDQYQHQGSLAAQTATRGRAGRGKDRNPKRPKRD